MAGRDQSQNRSVRSKGTYYSTTLRVPTPQLDLQTREFSDAEVHLIRGVLFDNPTRDVLATERERMVSKETETARSLHSPLTEPLWEVLRDKDPALKPPQPISPREEARVLMLSTDAVSRRDALPALKNARQKSPNDPEVLARLSNAYRELDDAADDALEAATAARKLRPWWATAWFREAQAALLAGRCAEALTAMRRHGDVVRGDEKSLAWSQKRLKSLEQVCANPALQTLDPSVRDCLRGVARTLRFARAPSGYQLLVTLPLTVEASTR